MSYQLPLWINVPLLFRFFFFSHSFDRDCFPIQKISCNSHGSPIKENTRYISVFTWSSSSQTSSPFASSYYWNPGQTKKIRRNAYTRHFCDTSITISSVRDVCVSEFYSWRFTIERRIVPGKRFTRSRVKRVFILLSSFLYFISDVSPFHLSI